MNLLREYVKKTISHHVRPTSGFSINDIPIKLEIANTPEKIQRGLMFRDRLDENCGMIFIFPDLQERSFWMRNTKIPLSIAYADHHGTILNIEDMNPFDETRVLSYGPAMCALEMNQGWFEKNGIKPGHKIMGL